MYAQRFETKYCIEYNSTAKTAALSYTFLHDHPYEIRNSKKKKKKKKSFISKDFINNNKYKKHKQGIALPTSYCSQNVQLQHTFENKY